MVDFDKQRMLAKNRVRRRGIYLLPNLFTTAALFAGFYAIVQGMNQRFDAAAIAMTVRLVTDAGFDPVVVGGLARAREFDAGTSVYVKGLTAAQLKAALELP